MKNSSLKIALNMLAATLVSDQQPKSEDVIKWYKTEILPLRTASPGSISRFFKGYSALFHKNTPDVNGVCGDVVSYLFREFEKKYPQFLSAYSGFNLGAILKTGVPSFNHIANVIYPYKLEKHLPITLSSENKILKDPALKDNTDPELNESKIKDEIIVLDLFYKEDPQTLNQWIEKRGYNNEEFILGREYDFT